MFIWWSQCTRMIVCSLINIWWVYDRKCVCIRVCKTIACSLVASQGLWFADVHRCFDGALCWQLFLLLLLLLLLLLQRYSLKDWCLHAEPWWETTHLSRGCTKKATEMISSTAVLVIGVENSLAPRGNKFLCSRAMGHATWNVILYSISLSIEWIKRKDFWMLHLWNQIPINRYCECQPTLP